MITLVDFFSNLDVWIQQTVAIHPSWVYLLLFSVVFLETSFLPVSPFLPGNSLLFSVGVLAADNELNLLLIIVFMIAGGVLGSWANYYVGKRYGVLLFEKIPGLQQTHLQQAKDFYDKHGNKALWFSRFVTVIRSLIPLMAGIAGMSSRRFWFSTIPSVSVWVISFILIGYYLGHLPVVKQYFAWVLFGTIMISVGSILYLGLRRWVRRGD